MSNQTGDRYTCTDPNCGCEIRIERPCSMVPAGTDKLWAEDSGGDGPVLVLLHEGVGDSRMWDPVWSGLTARFRVIPFEPPSISLVNSLMINLS